MSLLNIQRAAELLGDIGALFDHPGVADQGRKALAEEVLEVIQIDEHGIRAVLPAENLSVADSDRGGGGGGGGVERETGLEPATFCLGSRHSTN